MLADALLLLFGAVTALLALQLPLGRLHAPGSGLFPLVLGCVLMGLAAGHLGQAVVARAASASPVASTRRPTRVSRMMLFLATLALAIGLLDILGYPLVAFLLMLALLGILGLRRRRTAGLIAAGAAALAYHLFVQWLRIPLPKGWIGM